MTRRYAWAPRGHRAEQADHLGEAPPWPYTSERHRPRISIAAVWMAAGALGLVFWFVFAWWGGELVARWIVG